MICPQVGRLNPDIGPITPSLEQQQNPGQPHKVSMHSEALSNLPTPTLYTPFLKIYLGDKQQVSFCLLLYFVILDPTYE